MMFVGFGYLMTFLKWYGLGAVCFTIMITAVGLQWAVFTESFWGQLYNNTNEWHLVDFNIYSLLNALYAVSAVLISFGAVIGKVSHHYESKLIYDVFNFVTYYYAFILILPSV